MKISIPKEHRGRFKRDKTYITRWKGHSLLLMSREERDRLLERIDGISALEDTERALIRLMKAGIFEIEIVSGRAEIYGLAGWLEGAERTYQETPDGFVIR
jgi:DNA-binding transcriptional regulator/RsmH inhibitor MraZ